MDKKYNNQEELLADLLKAQDELFEDIKDAPTFFDKDKLDKILVLRKKLDDFIKEKNNAGNSIA